MHLLGPHLRPRLRPVHLRLLPRPTENVCDEEEEASKICLDGQVQVLTQLSHFGVCRPPSARYLPAHHQHPTFPFYGW